MVRLSPDRLAECLEALESGRLTLAECLAAHPDVAELRELLAVANAIPAAPASSPDPTFRAAGRRALLATIAERHDRVTKSPLACFWGVIRGGPRRPGHLTPRKLGMPALIIALLIALAAAGGGTVYAAQGALPGDALYPVKTGVEGVQLALATTDDAQAQAHLTLAGKRLAEIQATSRSNRADATAAAAAALARDVTAADQDLARTAATGADASDLAGLLKAHLTRVQATVAEVQATAPETARPALSQAALAARQGLTDASGYLRATPGPERAEGAPAPPVAAALGRSTPTPDAEIAAATGGGILPRATSAAPEISAAVDRLSADTRKLSADPQVPGRSLDGLLAKLDAARAALDRGQPEVAARILDAYRADLDALHRSGHISADDYAALAAGYQNLVASLGESPDAAATPSRGRPGEPAGPPGRPRGPDRDAGRAAGETGPAADAATPSPGVPLPVVVPPPRTSSAPHPKGKP